MATNDEIVLLGTASSEVEAGMWNQVLQSGGVRALIRSGGPGAGAWASSATFEHQVFVRSDQLKLAQSLLDGALGSADQWPRARKAAPRVNRITVNRGE